MSTPKASRVDPGGREAIFHMFERPDRSGDVDGTGIGLAICQRIVERHGARIWVDPAAGCGSPSRFTLPDAAHGAFVPAATDPAPERAAGEPGAEAAAA